MDPVTGTPRDRRAERRADAARHDGGATLIELLVSIVLIGTTGIAVLVAVTASARGAGIHRDISDVQAWLANAGDALTEADSLYLPCDDASVSTWVDIADSYELNIVDPLTAASPGAPSIEIVNVEFWDSATMTWGNFIGAEPDDCFHSEPTLPTPQEDRLQRLTLQTTVDEVTRTLVVVKRPDLPPTVNTQPPPTTLGGGNVIPTPTPGL